MLRRHTIVLAVLALSILPPRPGWGQVSDISPNLEASTRDDFNIARTRQDTDAVTNSTFTRQTHFLLLDVPLTPVLLFSYNMRYTNSDTRTDNRNGDGLKLISQSSNDIFEPQGELVWLTPYFEWSNGFRYRENDVESEETGRTRSEENFFSRLKAEERPFFPETKVLYEWIRNSDNLLVPQLDSNKNTLRVDLNKTAGPLQVLYEFDGDMFDNDISRLVEGTLHNKGDVIYYQSFFNQFVTAAVDYRVESTRTITRNPPLSSTVTQDFVVTRDLDDGLFLDQSTGPPDVDPTDDALVTGFSDLIDGDKTTTADPPGALSDVDLKNTRQNLGVRLQLSSTVDTLFVYINRPITVTQATLEAITWSVYVGTSANSWTAIAGVTVAYNTVEERFEFTLPETTGRFFRVRNEIASGTVENILVTEMEAGIQASRLDEFELKQRRVREHYEQNLTTRVTIQPFSFLSLTHDFFYNKDNIDPEDAEDIERLNAGTLSFTPHRTLIFQGRAQRSTTDLDGDEDVPLVEDRYSATIDYTPFETLRTSAGFTRTELFEKRQEGDVDTRRSDSLFYHITGEVLRNLTLGLETTWSRSWDLEEREPSDITAQTRLRVDATLRPDLRVSGDYAYGWTREGPQRAQARISDGQFLISYRPTDRITAGANYDFIDEGDTKGLEQTYSVSWTAFTGGALDCTVDAELTKDTRSNELTRLAGIVFVWEPRPLLQLTLRYDVSREDVDISRLERQEVFGTFNMRF